MSNNNMTWWASLKHGGLFIAPSKLKEYFAETIEPIPYYLEEKLRRDLNRLEEGDESHEKLFLDTLLEKVCGLHSNWSKGPQVDKRWSYKAITGETIRPARIWEQESGGLLPVFIDKEKRLAIGRGRRSVSRVIEWLRKAELKLAVITNYNQIRLVYAGLDHEAWVEWDRSLWFEEGESGPQVEALRTLISPQTFGQEDRKSLPKLLNAVLDSRKGQAELSSFLGERVRNAVEELIQSHSKALETLGDINKNAIYIAAARIIMRMVVVLFAEARDLLPRDMPIYYNSYGLQGLREELERVGGGSKNERLRHRYGAWPRIQSLFKLIFEGSHHESLPVQKYGGGLFEPGEIDSMDPIKQALAVFENRDNSPPDLTVFEILQLLCRSKVRVRQGRGHTLVDAPVDFSDLSSEYIGILYEGLLDFELRRVDGESPVIFLNLGNQPALELTRLESMDDKTLKSLVGKFKKGKSEVVESEEKIDIDEEKETEDREVEESGDELLHAEDIRLQALAKAREWAKKVVVLGGMAKKPKKEKAEALQLYEKEIDKHASSLIARLVLPGEWYLIRWGGTRKGSGTFYTRPGLAVPTVQRTLRPLAYTAPFDDKGEPDELAPHSKWIVKKPEDILSLKVCDSAMGSGSMLLAALRFLGEATYTGLFHYGWLNQKNNNIEAPGWDQRPEWFQNILRGLVTTSEVSVPLEKAEGFLKTRIKRVVVENIIYGVDIDPLAVELARLSLWLETLDRDLPFEFLDHKLKVGNSLVGCWFDRFQDYPVLAWEREGGDKTHSNGVHFKKATWTNKIRDRKNKEVKAGLINWIKGRGLFDEVPTETPEKIHKKAINLFKRLHVIPPHESEKKAKYYWGKVANNPDILKLKLSFDAWCSLWFWPGNRIDSAPLPQEFHSMSDEARTLVQELAIKHRFFHWELEFPGVFNEKDAGFDAIIGNPPWDIQKPNSNEFFSNINPLYRTYEKQEALEKQNELFTIENVEFDWLSYNSNFKALSNWTKNTSSPFGDGENNGLTFSFGKGLDGLHSVWKKRRKRIRFSTLPHPFQFQGSADINSYKLFLELNHSLLKKGGHQGLIVYAGLYSDEGSKLLRKLFINSCKWKWLFGFENKEGIFSIHKSYKFCCVILEKNGVTKEISSAFMVRDTQDWENGENTTFRYPAILVKKNSPNVYSFIEIKSVQEFKIIETIFENSSNLKPDKDDTWNINYCRELDMTTDSNIFRNQNYWKDKGYRPDIYGRWLNGNGDEILPLYQGVAIWQFDSNAADYLHGAGKSAKWQKRANIKTELFNPQFLASPDAVTKNKSSYKRELKVGFRAVQNATNQRTLISTLIPGNPCGNSVGTLNTGSFSNNILLVPFLNSFAIDWILRPKMSQGNVNWFLVSELPLPPLHTIPSIFREKLILSTASLIFSQTIFSPELLKLALYYPSIKNIPTSRFLAVTERERVSIRCICDSLVLLLFSLTYKQLHILLKENFHSVTDLRNKKFCRNLDPKGFWRVDKDKDPELRQTILTLIAFHDLQEFIKANGGDREKGIEAWCNQNDGEGWMIPEEICLADFGLGYDERAKKPQPVASRLGPRFLPWQLEQSVEESWKECEMHARNILGEEGFQKLEAEIENEKNGSLKSPGKESSRNGKLFEV
ncbi:Eco57I restriction-modification methylase domain-containing protein [Candidatus Riflebacteria bacterium]